MNDFYAILGVARNATTEQIRDRFLQLTREKHPDRFSGEEKSRAEEEFQSITQAFNVLSNPNRRRDHDMDLARPQKSTAADKSQLLKVYLQRGVKAFKGKNYLEAAENFRRATQADESSGVAWHHLARTCAEVDRYLPQAVEAITNACELEPMKASYHKLAGRIYTRAGEKEKALHAFRQAVQWGDDDPQIAEAIAELEGKKRKGLLGGIFGKTEQ